MGLVLSRSVDEAIVIGDEITVTVIESRGGRVRLLIEAPRDIPIRRSELPPENVVDAVSVVV